MTRIQAHIALPLFAVVAGCSGDPGGGTARWESAFDTSTAGSLSSVWGSGPDDVFIVGGTDPQGEVYHFDGSEWAPMDVPQEVPLLVWVYGFGPNDVYAVGTDGAAVHYDGSAWTALDTGTDQDLWGVFGFSPDDLWIVGGDVDAGPPVILHYDGSSFEQVELSAEQNPRRAGSLFKVWGIGSKLFAVGQNGAILEHTGGAWQAVSTGAEADQDFVSLWGTAEDRIVAVGGRSSGQIATYDGSAWTTVGLRTVGGLNGVFTDTPDQAVVCGINGYVGHYDLASGELVQENGLGSVAMHAVWGDGAGRHYAVGGNFVPDNHRGDALVRTVE